MFGITAPFFVAVFAARDFMGSVFDYPGSAEDDEQAPTVGSSSAEEYDFRKWFYFWKFLENEKGWKMIDGKGRTDTSKFFVPECLAKLRATAIGKLVQEAKKKAPETGTPVRTTRTAGKAPGSDVVTVKFTAPGSDVVTYPKVYLDEDSIEAMMNDNIDRDPNFGTEFKAFCSKVK